MSEFLHGAYGEINAVGSRVSAKGRMAMVVIGTAPVNTLPGGGSNVNRPVLVNNIAEARKYFGYSDNWDKYTLCEAMHVFFELKGVGPLVMINVLDVVAHKKTTSTSDTINHGDSGAPKSWTIANAEDIILDSVTVQGMTKGTDFTVTYNNRKKTIVIEALTDDGLGDSSKMVIGYDSIDHTKVTEDDLIGDTDDLGLNTGLYLMKNVYQATGYIPSYLIAPGWSSIPAVHEVMYENTRKINKHWDSWMFVDLPIVSGGVSLNLDTVSAWKKDNGYNKPNETVCFPMVSGTDGRKYHLSVLRAANFLERLIENDGIPYHTASNTEAAIIENLWLGADNVGRMYDDYIINERLNKYGITSAAYVGNRWAIWGASAADYNPEDATQINVGETNRMMLYYISNDFQHRRTRNVDEPLSPNDIATIVSEEQGKLDSLVQIGALTYGKASMNAELMDRSDMMNGDWAFNFDVTTTPLAKSLTAVVNWVDNGFETYFDTEVGE